MHCPLLEAAVGRLSGIIWARVTEEKLTALHKKPIRAIKATQHSLQKTHFPRLANSVVRLFHANRFRPTLMNRVLARGMWKIQRRNEGHTYHHKPVNRIDHLQVFLEVQF